MSKKLLSLLTVALVGFCFIAAAFAEERCCLPFYTPSFKILWQSTGYTITNDFILDFAETSPSGTDIHRITPEMVDQSGIINMVTLVANINSKLTIYNFWMFGTRWKTTLVLNGVIVDNIPIITEQEPFEIHVSPIFDISGDGKTGLEEAIYSLQTVAGIR